MLIGGILRDLIATFLVHISLQIFKTHGIILFCLNFLKIFRNCKNRAVLNLSIANLSIYKLGYMKAKV